MKYRAIYIKSIPYKPIHSFTGCLNYGMTGEAKYLHMAREGGGSVWGFIPDGSEVYLAVTDDEIYFPPQ